MSILDIARKIQQRIPVPTVAAPHEAFCIGLDLAADFAALCVLERITTTTPEMKKQGKFEPPTFINKTKKIHHLLCLERLPSTYPEIIEIVSTLIASLPTARMPPALAVNVTRVGKPVAILMVKAGLPVIAVTATSGDAEHRVAQGEFRVPQADLVSTLAVIMQSDRFRVSTDLTEAEKLTSELVNFSGDDDRWKDSDNLCRSVAIAAWWCERMMPVPKIKFSMAR